MQKKRIKEKKTLRISFNILNYSQNARKSLKINNLQKKNIVIFIIFQVRRKLLLFKMLNFTLKFSRMVKLALMLKVRKKDFYDI